MKNHREDDAAKDRAAKQAKVLNDLFADYRSEWIGHDFDERFVEPSYYSNFLEMRPTFLIGGRGTGKTIALRSLHFSNRGPDGRPRHFGIYVKAFKNRVLAFSGDHNAPEMWISAFEHYMNLLCCIELADLCVDLLPDAPSLPRKARAIRLLCEHLSISPQPDTFQQLYECLRLQLARLTKYVVAPRLVDRPAFSLGEQPVVDFARDVHAMVEIGDKPIYICIDEWENLSDAQQQTMNAWIKNSGAPISYKLGVRQHGMKTPLTGSAEDPLATPADYSKVDIATMSNTPFCKKVAERRLKLASSRGLNVPKLLSGFLPLVGPEEEAKILGAEEVVVREAGKQEAAGELDVSRWLQRVSVDEAYLAVHLTNDRKWAADLATIVRNAETNQTEWKGRVDNYRYASLFTITRGKKGETRRKLYAGSSTFLTLCGGNVRYLLELLDESVRLYVRERDDCAPDDDVVIGWDIQTRSASIVAKRHLDQIQGLSNDGLRIARLVVSVGTVLGELMRNPGSRAPEQTGFVLTGSPKDVANAQALLKEGCAILAFVGEPATKRTHGTETQQEEYRLHPILTPYFSASHRRKRRIRIDAGELLQAAEDFDGADALHQSITNRPIEDPQPDMLST